MSYSLTSLASTDCGDSSQKSAVYSDGTYVYAGLIDGYVYAMSFNGTSFTNLAAFNLSGYIGGVYQNITYITGDGSYIYVGVDNLTPSGVVVVLSYAGGSFTPHAYTGGFALITC